ncbi:MAG: hypothetical protein LW870_20940 [Pirellula sp.]|jgi:hypothetical protein|nr:hypothetical protein [Pirellula sp.]
MTNIERNELKFRHSENQGPVPLLVYTAGIQVVVAWLCLLGAYLSNGDGDIVRFLAIIVGCFTAFELGIVVFVTQLIWLLSDDEAEARSMPFIVGYVLISQSLLLLPVSIIITLWMIPLIIAVVVWIGWYFQRFTCFRLGSTEVSIHQGPLSLISVLLLPMWGLVSGLLIAAPFLMFGMFAEKPGPFIIYCSVGLFLVTLVPVAVAYCVLANLRSGKIFRCATIAAILFFGTLSSSIELYFTGWAFWSVVSMATIAFFVAGEWTAFQSYRTRGIRVLRVSPTISLTHARAVKFEDVY